MRIRHLKFIVMLLAIVVVMIKPPATAATQTRPGHSLYARLGGDTGIAAILDELIGRATTDDRISKHFTGADRDAMKTRMAEQICHLAGGPCTYTGRPMLAAHAGQGITDAEFMAFIQDLVASMEKLKIDPADIGALTGLLLPMKKEIVEKP